MSERPTPETDNNYYAYAFLEEYGYESSLQGAPVDWADFARRLESERDEARADLKFRRGLFQLQEQQLNEVRLERDEWKQKFIQQNKDLGCEMMDPAGTIWDHAKKLQDKIPALQEQLDAAIMLGKMQERDFEELIAAAKAIIDRWETPFWKESEHTGAYIAALRKAVEIAEGGYL